MDDSLTFKTDEQQSAEDAPQPEWAIAEIFGHRKHVGRCVEVTRFGAPMLRIDVPKNGDPDDPEWITHFYGGGSIFSYTLTDEKTAFEMNKPWAPAARFLPEPDEAEEDEDFDAEQEFYDRF